MSLLAAQRGPRSSASSRPSTSRSFTSASSWWRGLHQPDLRVARDDPRSACARAVRGRTAPHAGRVQRCLAVADDQPLSAGAARVGCRGDRPPPRAARSDSRPEPIVTGVDDGLRDSRLRRHPGRVVAYAVTLTRRLRRAREAAAGRRSCPRPHDLVSPASAPARRRAPGPWLVVAGLLAIPPRPSSAAEQRACVLPHPDRANPAQGWSARRLRLGVPGGAVLLYAGSATDLTFVLTDGETEITVLDRRAHQLIPREGGGRRGSLRADGVFELKRSSSSTTRRTSRRPTIRRLTMAATHGVAVVVATVCSGAVAAASIPPGARRCRPRDRGPAAVRDVAPSYACVAMAFSLPEPRLFDPVRGPATTRRRPRRSIPSSPWPRSRAASCSGRSC